MTAAEISEEGGEEMAGLNKFTFWRASCVQNPKNCAYPEKVVVTDAASFNEMAHFDHVSATYENNYRSNETFEESEVQSGDVITTRSQTRRTGYCVRTFIGSLKACRISSRKARIT